MRLEELVPGAGVRGLIAGSVARIVQVEWFGDQAVKVTFEEPGGGVRNRLVYRADEASLEPVGARRAWSFGGDGYLFRLASEAQRIRLGYLFDSYLALSTSLIEPLPHQITAVYGEMLPRQPLRFLLADDPGAGKTIMTALLVKELLIRGDLERCLVVAPGNLVEQWQDELAEKFHLEFAILTRDRIEASFDGRPLFPERRAYTLNYRLSADEAALYDAVTEYVREEMNRAERLAEGDQRRQNVGFALQILQRRLASSPAAIHESLRRRREKLERRIEESRLLQRGRNARLGAATSELASYRPEFFEDFDDQPEDEVEAVEERLVDSATVLERHRELMKQGAVLVDPRDQGLRLSVLVALDQAIQDGRADRHGRHQIVARQLHFVELFEDGALRDAGPAPYLDYRPASEPERAATLHRLEEPWLAADLEGRVVGHAIQHLVPREVEEVRARRLAQIEKVEREVQARFKREINYWDHRAEVLKDQERAGKQPRMNPQRAAARAEDLADRLQRRMAELARERDIAALPPLPIAGALIVPIGLLQKLGVEDGADEAAEPEIDPARRAEIERLAMDAVMATERELGFEPRDVSRDKCGYDVESRGPAGGGHLRFIEVKGLGPGNDRVTITRNELLRARNAMAWHRLAIVQVEGDTAASPRYISGHDFGEVGFAEIGRMLRLSELLAIAREPH